MNTFKQLTKFEKALWITSLAVVTAAFLLSPQRDYLSLAASLIGVTALIFISKGYVIGQVLLIFFAVVYGIVSFYYRYYGEVITYLFMSAPIALMSVISWLRHPYKDTNEVEVSRLSKKKVIILSVSAVIVTAAFYFILKALDNNNIFFSTLSVLTSFSAASLTFLRSPLYGLGYAANDLVLIVLWVLASIDNPAYIPMIFCFVMFLANDLYGFFNWTKMQKRQSVRS